MAGAGNSRKFITIVTLIDAVSSNPSVCTIFSNTLGLTEDMYDDGRLRDSYYTNIKLSPLTHVFLSSGFTTISNVDISRVVIDAMVDKYKDKPKLTCKYLALQKRN